LEQEPQDRFASAEELRLALQNFLTHRGSIRLAEEAAEQAETMAAPSNDSATDEELVALFSSAAFGFRQALHTWPENRVARGGLRSLLIARCERLLDKGNVGAAASLLDEVHDPPAELSRRVHEAQQEADERAARIAELKTFRDARDTRIGQGPRVFIASVLGLLFTVLPLFRIVGPTLAPGEIFAAYITGPALSLVLFGGLFVWAREAMTRTIVNRQTAWSILVLLSYQIILTLLCWANGTSEQLLLTLLFLLWSVMASMYAVAVERRTVPMALGYVSALAASTIWPAAGVWLMSAANAVFTVNAMVIWRAPRGTDQPEDASADALVR
jgi:eukaryotic-like serine/threonine-protein kinase